MGQTVNKKNKYNSNLMQLCRYGYTDTKEGPLKTPMCGRQEVAVMESYLTEMRDEGRHETKHNHVRIISGVLKIMFQVHFMKMTAQIVVTNQCSHWVL